MKTTFIDSGVLVTAARGVGEDSEKALEILADSNREFASSEFIAFPGLVWYTRRGTALPCPYT